MYHGCEHVAAHCELVRLCVRCCISDVASINRKVIKHHSDDFPGDITTLRAINRFSQDRRVIYSTPPVIPVTLGKQRETVLKHLVTLLPLGDRLQVFPFQILIPL